MSAQQNTQVMWEEYVKGRSPELKRELMQTYLGLAKYVAVKYTEVSTHVLGLLEPKDLEQIGVLGLLDAIDRYDPTRGVKFETYAVTRIRGTIQDELRRLDWVPRSIRKKERDEQLLREEMGLDDSVHAVSPLLAPRTPNFDVSHNTEELMDALSVDARTVDSVPADAAVDPMEQAGNSQLKAVLVRMVENLPEEDRLIVTLYYYEDLTFKDIGIILRLSESRVSQRHAAVMKRLRKQFGEAH